MFLQQAGLCGAENRLLWSEAQTPLPGEKNVFFFLLKIKRTKY